MMNLIMFLPEFFLGSLALGFLFFGLYRSAAQNGKESGLFLTLPKGVYYSILGLLLVLLGFLWFAHSFQGVAFSGFLISDRISIFSKTIICLISLPWIGFDGHVIDSTLKRDGITQFEHPALLIIFLMGTFLTVSAHHLFSLYLGLELQIFPLYALLVMKGGASPKEAALKYFLLSGIASIFLLYGLTLIYGFVGSGDFAEIFTSLEWGKHTSMGHSWLVVGFCLLLAGLLFKLGMPPFHFWRGDVALKVSNAHIPFLVGVSQIAGVILLIRVLFEAFHQLADLWKPILLGISLGGVVGGAIGAFFQKNIRLLFAFTGLFHLGVALLGFSLKGMEGGYAGFFYLFFFTVTIVGFFFFLGSLSTNDQNLDDIDQLGGLAKTQPLMALALSLLLLSLSGIPPLGGFWSLFYLLSALALENILATGIVLFCNVIIAASYIGVIRRICFDPPLQDIHSTLSWRVGWILISIFVILCPITQEFLLGIIRGMVDTL